MRTILQDLRYAVRQLIKLPGFTFTAVISLAFGIGATTAVFSVVYAIIMDPYPYAAPDRMIHLRLIDKDNRPRGFGLTAPQWQQFRHSPVIENAFLADDWSLTVTGSDVPEDVEASFFSSSIVITRCDERARGADGNFCTIDRSCRAGTRETKVAKIRRAPNTTLFGRTPWTEA